MASDRNVRPADIDKPHRCPTCWAVAVEGEPVRWWRVYRCCRCNSRFARWPWLAPVLPDVGIRCECRLNPEEARDGE